MALREVLANFTINVDKSKLDAARGAINAGAQAVKDFGNLLMGAAIVQGVRSFVAGVTQADTSIRKVAVSANMSAHDLQQWQVAAELSGAKAEDASAAVLSIKKALDAASVAGASSSAAFMGLGVNVRDASGKVRATNDVMKEVVGKIVAIPDPARRAQKAVQVFGDAGTKLLPMFAKGKEGVNDLLGQLDALGGGFSGESLEAIQNYNLQMQKFEIASMGLKSSVATFLLPILSRIAEGMSKMVAAFNKSDDASKRLKTALTVLGVIGFAAGVKMALPYLGMALAIAAVILIVDDLKTALEGGDSATAALLDKIFGEGTGKTFFEGVKKDLKDYKAVADKETGAWNKTKAVVEEWLSRTGEAIVKWVVEDVPKFFKDSAKSIGEAAVTAITGWWGTVKEWFKSKVEEMKTFGKDLINGMIEGLKETVGLESATKKAVEKALQAADVAAHRKSPAGKTREQSVDWVRGWAKGLDEENSAEQAMSAKVSRVLRVGNVTAASMARNNQVNSTHYNQITIQGTGAAAVRAGLSQSAEDDRRAALAALERTA